MKTLCVICSYYLTPKQIYGRMQKHAVRLGAEFGGVIVSNRGSSDVSLPPGWMAIRGSNTLMDFSAYHEGIAHIRSMGDMPSRLLILNDSLFTNHNSLWNMRKMLAYGDFIDQLDKPAMVGKVDRYASVCFQNPWSGMNAYVSSYCFLISHKGIDLFDEIYRNMATEVGDSLNDIRNEADGGNVEQSFYDYLRLHLTTSHDPISWYKAGLYLNQPDILRKKAYCVYLEHRLSGAIGREGCILAINPHPRDQFAFFVMEQRAKLARAFGL